MIRYSIYFILSISLFVSVHNNWKMSYEIDHLQSVILMGGENCLMKKDILKHYNKENVRLKEQFDQLKTNYDLAIDSLQEHKSKEYKKDVIASMREIYKKIDTEM